MLSIPKFHLNNLCFIIKVLLENNYPLNFIFENINNCLKKIIMVRKSVVNDDRIETVQPSCSSFRVTDFDRLNSERMKVSFYSNIILINCKNSLRRIRTL